MAKIFILLCLFLSSSCFYRPSAPIQPTAPIAQPPPRPIQPRPPIVRNTPKYPDPIKQRGCKARGRDICERDDDCQDACDDIFSRRSDKRDCYELPKELVYDFEKLIDDVEDGEVEEIDPQTLECMLDIDERNFADAIKKMGSRDAKEFLEILADRDNEDLIEVLEQEDNEFNILKQILHEAFGNDGLQDLLEEELDDDKSFFWLAAEAGKDSPAWDYLDNYVDEECERDSYCDGIDDGEPVQAYCNAFVNGLRKDSDREDFLDDAEAFEELYKDDIEDDDYEYELNDNADNELGVEAWCEVQIGTGTTNLCDENAIPVTFGSGTSSNHFIVTTTSSFPTGITKLVYIKDRTFGLMDTWVITFSDSTTQASSDLNKLVIKSDDRNSQELNVIARNDPRTQKITQGSLAEDYSGDSNVKICFKNDDAYL